MQITFLGTSCMQPTKQRNHSAILLVDEGENVLFDCGEGTQRQLKVAGIKPAKITKICVTHWHGDHVLGLPGLLQTMSASEYAGKLKVYGPKGTKKYFSKMFDWFDAKRPLEVEVTESEGGKIFENNKFKIECAQMNHGPKPCLGYAFTEKDRRRIKLLFVKKHKIPEGPLLGKLQRGMAVMFKGKKITPDEATYLVKGKKFVYITDTMVCDNITKLAAEADLLVLEATYRNDLERKAEAYFHLTAKEAGLLANKANAKKLVLTHFSQRYKNVKDVEEDAREVFDNTEAAEDFMKIKV